MSFESTPMTEIVSSAWGVINSVDVPAGSPIAVGPGGPLTDTTLDDIDELVLSWDEFLLRGESVAEDDLDDCDASCGRRWLLR